MSEQRLHVTADLHCVPDLQVALHEALVSAQFDAVSVPLVHPRLSRNQIVHAECRDEPLTRSDLLLDSSQWTSCVTGKISPWIQLDCAHAATQTNAELVFKQEMAWASHLQVPVVMLPELRSFECSNYARVVNQTLLGLSYAQLQVPLQLVSRAAQRRSLQV
jgi:protein arginine N-methyltransferase 5